MELIITFTNSTVNGVIVLVLYFVTHIAVIISKPHAGIPSGVFWQELFEVQAQIIILRKVVGKHVHFPQILMPDHSTDDSRATS